MTFAGLAQEIHAANIAAGWWKQIDGVTQPRNIGELLCLVHSEISESDEGSDGWKMDDKLPHRKMSEVELADVAIRVLDILGYYGVNVYPVEGIPRRMMFADWLALMHRITSEAMEGFRKGRDDRGCQSLVRLLWVVEAAADDYKWDLMGAIAEKRAFNAQRADHRPENRAAEGGKKF